MANVLLGPPVTVNVTLELATERTTVNVSGALPSIDQPPAGVLGARLGGDVAPRMIQLKAQLQF